MPKRPVFDHFARAVRSPDLPWFLRDTPYPMVHLGTVDSVDSGRNTISYAWNHPSGTVTDGIPVLLPYSDTHQPAAGHAVRLMTFAGIAMVLGRQVSPSGTIIVP